MWEDQIQQFRPYIKKSMANLLLGLSYSVIILRLFYWQQQELANIWLISTCQIVILSIQEVLESCQNSLVYKSVFHVQSIFLHLYPNFLFILRLTPVCPEIATRFPRSCPEIDLGLSKSCPYFSMRCCRYYKFAPKVTAPMLLE